MEERFNRVAKEWRFAADAASITDETAGSEDRTRTSGGVFIAVDSTFGPVVRERKKEQWRQTQATRVESPRLG